MAQRKISFGTITITPRAKELVAQCLESGRVSGGRLVRQFEDAVASLLGVHEAVAVSSGTDALMVALAALYDYGASRGDEVIIPALSFIATGNAVLHAGLTPVFVDVTPETLNIDPSRIEALITPKTRAIVPVHLMGKPAEMDAILDIAKRHNLMVIEDAAEAWGAQYKGRLAGSMGDFGCFSLYVAHIISTGEGGVVTTTSEERARALRSLRCHGRSCECKECVLNVASGYCAKRFEGEDKQDIRFRFGRVGFSSKMNDMEAALGLGGMDSFDHILAVRRRNLLAMIAAFKEFEEYLWTYEEQPYECIGPHAFPFLVKESAPFTREDIMLHLEQHGIESRTLFSSIPTQCAGYEFLGYKPGDFPVAEAVGRNGVHIGVHQDIGPDDIDWIMKTVREFITSRVR